MISLDPKKWIFAGEVCNFPSGKKIEVKIDEKTIFIMLQNKKWFAFDTKCPHMSRSIRDSYINAEMLECRWHNIKFDLNTGAIIDDSGYFYIPPLKVYPVRIIEEKVYVKIITRIP